jgi:predicted MPP superfamily phosphohydrolase/tetratricopeptide (TPR) repeat protein
MESVMLASIGLLHFSDLHVGTQGLNAEWPTIEDALFTDLEGIYKDAGPWDLVVFTGDLAFKGHRKEFESAHAFLTGLWAKFRELGCTPRLVAIPGNHDLAWPEDDWTQSLLSEWGDVATREDFWGKDSRGYRKRVRKAFREYERWWDALSIDVETADVPALELTHKGYLPGDFSATLEKDGIKLGVLGLNSTFLQLGPGIEEGTLAVDAEQIRKAGGGHPPNWAKPHAEVLLLTHQPLAWLRPMAREQVQRHALGAVKPVLHLFGHLHEAEQRSESISGSAQQHRLQGAALFGLEGWGTDKEERMHGYSACRLEFDEDLTRLRLWPRRMERQPDGAWEFEADHRDYHFKHGTEEIEPIVKPRTHPLPGIPSRPAGLANALGREAAVHVWDDADFEAGLAKSFTGDEIGTTTWEGPVDVAALRAGHLGEIQPQFLGLGHEFDKWLGARNDLPGDPDRLRVFWLIGDDVPYRAKGRLACLARAGANHLVADAGRDLTSGVKALDWCFGHLRGSTTALISLELDADTPSPFARVMSGALARGRNLGRTDSLTRPKLVIAGTMDQAEQTHRDLRQLLEISIFDTTGRHVRHGRGAASTAHVFSQGLPMTASRLFGRDAELLRLRDAWRSRTTRVLSIVAFGGTGKSSLVNTWLEEMSREGYRGADRVLAWSFYSQGTKENLVSADEFVGRSLEWLEVETVSLNPWARGRDLADRIKEQGRALVVLDGVEPLQHPPDVADVGGRLTDDSIWALLESLARDDWNGLCVITTRVELSDLRPFEPGGPEHSGTVEKLELRNLDEVYGAQLLGHLLGEEADPSELRAVVRDVGGHALAITLLGHYLRDVHAGSLSGRVDLGELTKSEREGGHARRVMDAYARWFHDNDHLAHLAILRLIGLFDRPAEPEAMTALLADPSLLRLVEPLDRVGGTTWNATVEALRRASLLNPPFPDDVGVLDAHPLVREHFRDDMRTEDLETWQEGNRRLFHHYSSQAPPLPKDSKEMAPLYAAVAHGCAAELYQAVFDDILLPRVWRDRRTNYSTRHLGQTGADLVALSNYFRDRRWTDLRDIPLTREAQVLIRTNAGVRLRQLGRLRDARDCFGAVVAATRPDEATPEELENASYAAAQDCELLVVDGHLLPSDGDGGESALGSGQRAVEYADHGRDAYFQMHARSSLAEVHFMLGDLEQAGVLFGEAREIERTGGPRPPFLYSQSLYRYGYYLIERGCAASIVAEADGNPNWGTNEPDTSLLSKAIRLLILGAARRCLIEEGDRSPVLIAEAARILDEAHDQFQAAGYLDYVVRGLLERSHFYRVRRARGDRAKAVADLRKAALEADRGQMLLLFADAQLGRAACGLNFWRHMTEPERADVGPEIVDALGLGAELVGSIRYGRRDDMVADLRKRASKAELNVG